MTTWGSSLEEHVAEAFGRRAAPVSGLATQAVALVATARSMAARFGQGGRLLVFGNGAGTTDAQHIAVEFVHPVIVGKRPLPALSLVSDAATVMGVSSRHGLSAIFAHQIEVLGRPQDMALGLSGDGRCTNVRAGLRSARDRGLLTVALVGADGGDICAAHEAEHLVTVGSDDPLVVKEGHVTAYHLLWELVHVYLDAVTTTTPTDGFGALYPFLGGSDPTAADELDAAAAASVRAKVEEVVTLRSAVSGAVAGPLAVCARQVATAFAGGGTLLAFGNGGSSTDAQDVVHTFVDPPHGPPLPALGLTNDVAVVTALSNDVGFEVVFARQVRAFGRPGDIALALSTSGGSANVLAALEEAARLGLLTVGLAGYGGGRLRDLACLQHLFAVPSASVHRVQEVQTTLYHVLWSAVVSAHHSGVPLYQRRFLTPG